MIPQAGRVLSTQAEEGVLHDLLVPFDEEAKAELIEAYPFYFHVPIPAGTPQGCERTTGQPMEVRDRSG